MDVFNASMLAGSPERMAALIAPLLRREVAGVSIRSHACPGTTVEDVMPLAAKRPMVA